MTLGDIIFQIEAASADILHTTVDHLPSDEQLHRFFTEPMLAMDATLEWFDAPRHNGDFLEAGEIRIPQIGFRYGIMQTEYTHRFRAALMAGEFKTHLTHIATMQGACQSDIERCRDGILRLADSERRAASDGAGE